MKKQIFHYYHLYISFIPYHFSLLHEFNDTSADERLRVRVTHGHKHVLADGDAAAPFREYGRVVLQAAHPHQQ